MPSVDTPPFQITPDSEDPYIILQDFNASDPDITESVPAPSFPTQPTSTTITDHASTQPTLTPTTDITTTQSIHVSSHTQNPTIRRRASYRRVRGRNIHLTSALSSVPRRRTRSSYEHTPTSPLPHSPPHQRLRRAIETDSEEDPEEEPLPAEVTPDETAPVEHITEHTGTDGSMRPLEIILEDVPITCETGQSSRDAQIQGGAIDDDIPSGLGQGAVTLHTLEKGLGVDPSTFEIEQGSRRVYEEEINGEIWRDVECVFSAAPRAVSPDYTPSSPSFVPPSPSVPVSTPPVASPVEDGEVTGLEQIFVLLGSHESLLEEHTEQLDRFGRLDDSTGMLGGELEGMRHCVGMMRSELTSVWDIAWRQWHQMHDMESQIARLTRAGQEDRYEILAARRRISDLEFTKDLVHAQEQRITSLETRLGAHLTIIQDSSRRLEQLENTQAELVLGMELLRVE